MGGPWRPLGGPWWSLGSSWEVIEALRGRSGQPRRPGGDPEAHEGSRYPPWRRLVPPPQECIPWILLPFCIFAGPTAQRRVRSRATIPLSNQLPVSFYLFQILFTVSVRGALGPCIDCSLPMMSVALGDPPGPPRGPPRALQDPPELPGTPQRAPREDPEPTQGRPKDAQGRPGTLQTPPR